MTAFFPRPISAAEKSNYDMTQVMRRHEQHLASLGVQHGTLTSGGKRVFTSLCRLPDRMNIIPQNYYFDIMVMLHFDSNTPLLQCKSGSSYPPQPSFYLLACCCDLVERCTCGANRMSQNCFVHFFVMLIQRSKSILQVHYIPVEHHNHWPAQWSRCRVSAWDW